ncbi:MAG: L-2-amino-thiazoline-4-carboxylic acid hydrolase [Deltaproteobacteria bacterium]|nr:L-2-amino-thiazoline-4-carboxylic acid hydrolase [Deltaproteobacteria bacterium]MBW1930461.1 L-2-amino-thiazoline-4-carboxylic acid hydrolase [Deltaproteobacteria bacterium]MBW2026910.1 L-2-amino-thiazoline-4-carboxylic acid hydrolase [Deltaproteobacteria bacterium]
MNPGQDDLNLRKIMKPLLIYMMKRHIKYPRLFLLKCALTFGSFKRRIDTNRFPADFIALTAMPLWIYINLKKVLGQQKAYEIMRIPALTAGVAKQNILFDPVNKGRGFKQFIEKEFEINKTGTTRWNTIEIKLQTEKRLEFVVTKCLFHEFTTSLGIPEATSLICQTDNALFNSYLPERLIFHRGGVGKRIADGNECCHFIWELVDEDKPTR